MKRIPYTLALAGLLAFGGCSSTDVDAESPCICGTHAAAVHGCHAPACVSGEGDPDNPDCHCAPLEVAKPAEDGDS